MNSAFILRIAPGGEDMVSSALDENQLIIGWSHADGLLDNSLNWEEFRAIVSQTYYSDKESLRTAGASAGHLWRFIREMNIGDLVIVPHGSNFYVAEIKGEATYDKSKVQLDSAYRRNISWLNQKKPISRNLAKSDLVSRMKAYGTCTYAGDLLDEIKDCLDIALKDEKRDFESDLQSRLVKEALKELREGRIDSYGFEELIRKVMLRLGAKEAKVIPRSQDKGADIIAIFQVAGAFKQTVAIQAKHWKPEPAVSSEVVNQLIKGIDAESADLGIVITTGEISDNAIRSAKKFYDEKGIRIEMIDGEQFAKILIESGVSYD